MSIKLEHPSDDSSPREVGGSDVALLERSVEAADPFDINIEFIQNTPASENRPARSASSRWPNRRSFDWLVDYS